MKSSAFGLLAIVLLLCGEFENASAQELTIVNARIIVGNGTVVDNGSLVISGGRIKSVTAGTPVTSTGEVMDARGMTLVPGFIDGHRHIIRGNPEQWLAQDARQRMQEFLEAGYTTLVSGGGAAEPIVELKRRTESGELVGPRIIASGPLTLANSSAETARDTIRKLASRAIRFTGEVHVHSFKPDPSELAILAAAIDEGAKVGVQVAVHAASVPAMLAAVNAGAKRLVHTPHFSWLSDADAKRVRDAGVLALSTVGFGAPVFNVFNDKNIPTFRDGGKWPDSILDGEGSGREAGYKAVNARTLWDAGVVYGFGTDTGYLPSAGLAHELRTLNFMFSTIDIIRLMGPNSAAWIGMGEDLGTLEPGKMADIVIVRGNPLDGYWNLLNPAVVLKDGVVVVDKRN